MRTASFAGAKILGAASFAALLLAGCGGGGTTNALPTVGMTTVTIPLTGTISQTLPPVPSGLTGSVTIPAAYLGATGTFNVSFTAAAPAGLPPASSVAVPAGAKAGTANPIAFISLMLSGPAVTLNTAPSFSVTPPAPTILPVGLYDVVAYDQQQPSAGYVLLGPVLLNNNSLTFTPRASIYPFAANDTVTYGLFGFALAGA